jgi:hypothetical protein
VSAGSAVTPATIQTSLQGTPEGAIVAAAAGGGAAPSVGGSLAGTLRIASDGVNGSPAQGATSGATAAVGVTLPPVPVVDAVAAATGADKPVIPGIISIILPRPKLP